MKEKILVINDDESIRELVKFGLSIGGYEISEANCGRLGIELAYKQNPDLILLDIMMPEMDGFETCQILKASPITNNIPVIFFSSLTNPKDKIKGLKLGAVDFVNNVVDQGELLARVQTHLHIQSLTRSLKESNEQLIQKQNKLNDDLQAASMIQKSFLAPMKQKVSNLDIASAWMPVHTLGGDIFNIIEFGNDKAIIYMIDVSGHDVPSALVTVSVSQFLYQKNKTSPFVYSPVQMMQDLDREYPLERFDRYFTLFYIVLDIPSGTLSYSCAGHPPALVLSKNNGLKFLDKGGTIIGLNKGISFEEGVEILSHGDKVILYTDGVIETRNREGQLYGTERFYSLLLEKKSKAPEEIVNEIKLSLKEFGKDDQFDDDISIMCFEYI